MIKSILYCQICGFRITPQKFNNTFKYYCTNCENFSYLDPKVATVILIENNKSLLLVKRDIEPHIGHWSFPSGYVDRGEKIEDAAIREVKEETDIDINITNLQGVYSGKGPVVLVVYAAIALDPSIGKPKEEVQEIKWFPIKKLPVLPFPYDDKIVSDYLTQ